MAKWSILLLVTLALFHTSTAREVPADAKGLDDQKNVVTFGGLGGYSGIGANGLPIGGVGAGVGAGGDLGGVTGLGGVGGAVGVGAGGGGGFGGAGGLPGVGGVGGVGGLPGVGGGGGAGALPFP